ncbi:hypothetical protein [Acerihabitans sp.]|uniref:hypothetical protein n=1 Tax=Acerihabitans sp. TaxID=2811394 RepID=UPI002ED83279
MLISNELHIFSRNSFTSNKKNKLPLLIGTTHSLSQVSNREQGWAGVKKNSTIDTGNKHLLDHDSSSVLAAVNSHDQDGGEKTQQVFFRLLYLLAGILGCGMLLYYLRYGGDPKAGERWPKALPMRAPRFNRQAYDYATLPACAHQGEHMAYWRQLREKINTYAVMNAAMDRPETNIIMPAHNNSTSVILNPGKNTTSRHAGMVERNTWLHTFGLSQEFPPTSHRVTTEFIDMLLSDVVQRKYGMSLTSQQLATSISLIIHYLKKNHAGLSPVREIARGNYTVRQVLLKEPYVFKLNDDEETDKYDYIVLRTIILDSDKHDFLSYLEFIINGDAVSLTADFERLVDYFHASEDISTAYITMAKNRLAAALFPFMGKNADGGIRKIIQRWTDRQIEEKLVSLAAPEGRFTVPALIAIAESTGGLLISLATGAVYLWTPDDVSDALRMFIAGHLSVQHKTWLEATSLAPKLNEHDCVLTPAILFVNSANIWQSLKTLDAEKLDEHIDYHSLVFATPAQYGDDGLVQQRLQASGNALYLLSLFFSGGSPAGCAAMALGNVLSIAGNALYLHQVASGQGEGHRKQAWESALLSMVITGLAGAADIYDVMKSYGSKGYELLHDQAAKVVEVVNSATADTQAAETFVNAGIRDRLVMLMKGLLNENNKHLNILGNNNIKAMLKVYQLCHGMEHEGYHFEREKLLGEETGIPKITIHKTESMSSIPAGYKVSVVDNINNQPTLSLLCLGRGRFAGFGLKKLDQSLSDSHWQEVGGDAFKFNNQQLVLDNGRSATLRVENYHAMSMSTLSENIFNYDSNFSLKFRRYCNRFKFEENINQLLKGVERFAINSGFDDIRYRAMFIFDPNVSSDIIRHYLLAARYENINYLLEPHAENIRFIKLPDIEDVAILTEDKWTQSFKNSGSTALITYKDFATEQMAKDYRPIFSISRDNEQLVVSPPGFTELMQPAAPITFSMFLSNYDGVEQLLLLQKKIRKFIITDHKSKNSYEFILSAMQKTGRLTLIDKNALLEAYKNNPQQAVLDIIQSPVQIKSFNDMLCIEPGKLVRFTQVEDSSISHFMLSVGNGRFAGMNNRLLDVELGDEKRIMIAEQLGVFKEDALYTYSQHKIFMVEKGDLRNAPLPTKSLMDIAKDVSAKTSSEKSSIRFALEILIGAKKIVPQQADALERLAKLIISKMDGDIISLNKLNKFLVLNKCIDNNAELENIAAGKLVVFYTEEKDFHVMVSLGGDRFVGINNHHINDRLNADQMFISSQEIGTIIGGRRINNQKSFLVWVGDPNLEKTRISALLGPDGRIGYIRHGLDNLQMEIKAHGALTSINHYDAIEFADIINGIHRSLHPDQPISHIELISCFGALGGRRSSAQIISDRLGTTVESYRGVITDSKSRNRGSGVTFSPLRGCGIERRRDNERWHRRIHDFIEDSLSLLGNLPFQRHSRAVAENTPFGIVVIDVLHFLRKEIGAQTLMRFYPDLMTAESLYQASLLASPAGDEETLIAAMLTIFYGSANMINALDAYILSREYKDLPPGSVVVDGRSLHHPLHWRDVEPSLASFRQLPSVVVTRNLQPGSNIYISLTDDKDHLDEYLIRVGNKCNRKTLWPLLLANFFKEQLGHFPIMAGIRSQDILTLGFDFSHFHFYLNSWLRSDFSLQIDMTTEEPRLVPVQPPQYVRFSETGGRRTDTREDIGLGHSLLVENAQGLALQMNETLAVDRPGSPGDDENIDPAFHPLPSRPRVVITLLENRERLVMLQRNIPAEIISNQSEVAFYIASEINKYTETIKLGAKNYLDITPVKSNIGNFIYGDPGIVQKSWILINLIHND